MSTLKKGDIVKVVNRMANREGVEIGDFLQVAEDQDGAGVFVKVILPSGQSKHGWRADRFEKVDSWTNKHLVNYTYLVKEGEVWAFYAGKLGKPWKTGYTAEDLKDTQEFTKNPAVETSEHGFTEGQLLYTSNPMWPQIRFIEEQTWDGETWVRGFHTEWGGSGAFRLGDISTQPSVAEEAPEEPPFAREGVVYSPRESLWSFVKYRIVGDKLMGSTAAGGESGVFKVSDINPDDFVIVSVDEPEDDGAWQDEELPPVSRKHFDESKAAAERRRQKLIKHVETLQARLGEKNKVIAEKNRMLAERDMTIRRIHEIAGSI